MSIKNMGMLDEMINITIKYIFIYYKYQLIEG